MELADKVEKMWPLYLSGAERRVIAAALRTAIHVRWDVRLDTEEAATNPLAAAGLVLGGNRCP